MKRLLLAAILVLSFALIRAGARAEADDAYGSLVGMADSATGDRGPQAGEIPPDNPAMPASAAIPARAPKKTSAESPKDEDAPAVSVPPAAPPRVWTRLFASLLPPPARPASFEVALSTAPRRARAKTAPTGR